VEPSGIIGHFVGKYRNQLGLVVAIAAVLIFTASVNDAYRTRPGYNATEILRQSSLLGIFALGSAVVIIAGGIDLSSGSVIAFSGSICALTMQLLSPVTERGGPDTSQLGPEILAAGVAAAIAVGLLIGTLHAWLITCVGLPPFVATLASLVGLRSLARVINPVATHWLGDQKMKVNIDDPDFTWIGNHWQVPLVVFLLTGLLTWILLSRTVVGRHLYALGGNEQAARLSGVRTDGLKWLAYVISAVTASIAGVLYTAEVSAADPQTQGMGYELRAIAAAVVGGCSLQGGVGTAGGVMLGVLFLRVVIDSVAKVVGSGSDDYEGMIVGFLVVLAVAINSLRHAGAGQRKFFPGLLGWITIPTLALLLGVVVAATSNSGAGIAAAVGSCVFFFAIKLWEERRSA
jgi:ribose/xylose/arabinose/galactoside ABC-type transport system permease subunit